MTALALALLLAAPSGVPSAGSALTTTLVSPEPARATYAVSRLGRPGPALRPHRAAGFVQRVQLRSDGRSEVTVYVEPSALVLPAPWPPDANAWPAGVARRARHDEESAPTPLVEAFGRDLAEGARTELEAAERILGWVSREIRPLDEPGHDDSAAAAFGTGRASCVGRSRLAAALLRSAGLPARTVHGLVVPRRLSRNQPAGSAEFRLHRWVEVWLSGAGWVPSDPGESLFLVDTRHLVLAVDDSGYDPEQQRDLVVTLVSSPGPLVLAQPAGEGPLLVRRDLRSAARRPGPEGRSP